MKIDPSSFADEIAAGYIRVRRHPEFPISIYNYTEKATFDKAWWSPWVQLCRGLIIDDATHEVLAQPWPKFFNYSEFGDAYLWDLDASVEVTDKIDGSLGILYWWQGEPHIATRGSFESEQAKHATALYRKWYHGRWAPLSTNTYLFEIVYPSNRIVVDYGDQDDIVLLGAVDRATERLLSPTECTGWPGPRTTVLQARTLREALALKPRKNAEGVVIRFTGYDMMVKVKQEDYIALHRLVTGLSERTVWEWMGDPHRPDLVSQMPEEFGPWILEVGGRLKTEANLIRRSARKEFLKILTDIGGYRQDDRENRKAFAVNAVKSPYVSLLFMLYDKRDVTNAIWQMVKPEAEKPYLTREEL